MARLAQLGTRVNPPTTGFLSNRPPAREDTSSNTTATGTTATAKQVRRDARK